MSGKKYSNKGDSVFTIISVEHFANDELRRLNAGADAEAMRTTLHDFGMNEYNPRIGKLFPIKQSRLIPPKIPRNCNAFFVTIRGTHCITRRPSYKRRQSYVCI